ncbi:PREDICTED: non-lysosomal glucosylceramidase [Ceratosolen solmsi marchali]|uniref:Non-lysosomal glucosylceramidase n=1 Tax=Ceratosolen solmsi marchali TaxID=326594 RepID=A0AAJ6YG56_9HYME|nr:PREDICTED: non-lysosomal glucosylceramidase [Ceratosolen solmsi marchali]
METTAKNIPKYGFKVRLDHEFPEKWSQRLRPKFKQTIQMLPLAWRYAFYYASISRTGRPVVMDYRNMQNGQQIYGVPIGGLGGGTIGRGFRGEFCRYALLPGLYNYHVIPANQFILTVRDGNENAIYNQVLSTKTKPKVLKSWKWGFDGKKASYTGLYPRSWTTYEVEECGLRLTCRQVSPVLPHNYKDSSLPCAVFAWDIVNSSKKDLQISITFSFQSGYGNKENSQGDKWTELFDLDDVSGAMIHQEFRSMPCTYAISSRSRRDNDKNEGNIDVVSVTRMLNFDPRGDGAILWQKLQNDGKLYEHKEPRASSKSKKSIATAVCANTLVKSGSSGTLEFSVVWDMPKIHFHNKNTNYSRYYTKYFSPSDGSKVSVAPEIARYALSHYENWEQEIQRWQKPVLEDADLPDWYKSALFNELYFVADGGSIWLRINETDKLQPDDPRIEYGRFAYLEGHEYRMYNTYDVHFYAAFALAQLWPNLEACIQYEFRDSVHAENQQRLQTLYDGARIQRKFKESVPHDIGDPGEEPFNMINAYPIHDVSQWRDLDSKFILSCYRIYFFNNNLKHLKDFWPTIKKLLEHSMTFDEDNDGLIENGGFPDQTYDCWIMNGSSAYCGSLWIAALQASVKMAELLNEQEDSFKYKEILDRAKIAFQDKLWNGKYYNFDCSKGLKRNSIMSDQLCGHWILRACGFTYEAFPEDRVKSSLKTIFQNNVMKYRNGQQGAVNGCLPTGSVDYSSIQSEEMWTGVAYGLAALLIHEGMIEEAFRTSEGVYRTIYEKIGMGFETPEALYEQKVYRAIGYMRPLSIWAMHHAWTTRKISSVGTTDDALDQ